MVTQIRASSEARNLEVEVVTMALAEVVLNGDVSLESVMSGIQAFLMALVASGQADAGPVGCHLHEMAPFFESMKNKA
jgi:hypothetical protein